MLEIKLTRAMEPDEMREQPCGICGLEFRPDAVLANLVTPYDWAPICEVCFSYLAGRAEEGTAAAGWGSLYRRYLVAASEHREPVFPSREALEAEEDKCPPGWGLAVPEL